MKKVLSLVLVAVMVVSMFAGLQISSSALAPTGQCGENVYWTFDESTGTLTISGEGDMYDYKWSNELDSPDTPFTSDEIKTVIIGDGVTSIGEDAFFECFGLTSVTISDSVKYIHDSFIFCQALSSVEIPASVINISSYAFGGCGLSSITVDENNDYYDSRNDCNAVIKSDTNELIFGSENTVIPNSVTRIGDYAFSRIYFKNITIPDSVISIGEYAFSNCSALTNVTIPDSVVSIGEGTFAFCYALTNVTIPDSVVSIGKGAFDYCKGLTDVYYTGSQEQWESINISEENDSLLDANIHFEWTGIPLQNQFEVWESEDYVEISKYTGNADELTIPSTWNRKPVKSIGAWAFLNCNSLTSVTIPDTVTSIGECAFENCRNLASIIIPDSVTFLDQYAFQGCSSLTSVNLPNSIKGIGWGLFYGCSNLTSITIPSSCTYIAGAAFYNCNSLKDVYYNGTSAQWRNITIDEEDNDALFNATIHCTDNTVKKVIGVNFTPVEDYVLMEESSYGWYSYDDDGNKFYRYSLDNYASGGYASGDKLTFTYDDESSETFTYKEMEGWLDENGEVVNLKGLERCDDQYDNHWTVGSDNGFWYEYKGVKSNVIPVTILADTNADKDFKYAIDEETDTVSIVRYKGNDTDVIIPSTWQGKPVTSIEDYAFDERGFLTSVVIPDSVTSIGCGAFFDCYNLCKITIPASVKNIGQYAFAYCDSLSNVSYSGTLEDWKKIEIGEYNEDLTDAYIGIKAVTYTPVEDYVLMEEASNGFYSTDESGARYYCYNMSNYSSGGRGFAGGDKATITYGDDSTATFTYDEMEGWLDEDGNYAILRLVIKDDQDENHWTVGGNNTLWCECRGVKSNLIPVTIIANPNMDENFVYKVNESNDTVTIAAYRGNGTEVIIPSTWDGKPVVGIANSAFDHCDNITSVTIPGSVTSIGRAAFWYCESLETVTLGNSVTDIYEYAFYGCNSLKNVLYAGTENQWGNVNIGDENSCLTDANIVFGYTEHEHIFGEGVISKEPSCNKAGTKIFTCTICGFEKYEDYGEPTGIHKYVNGFCDDCGAKDPDYAFPVLTGNCTQTVSVTEGRMYYATFTPDKDGTIKFYSTGNGDTYGYIYDGNMKLLISNDDDSGYNFGMIYDVEAGKEYVLACRMYEGSGDITFHFEYIPNHEHAYVPSVTTEPTCTQDGVMTYTCECGEFYTEPIEKLGHNYVPEVTAPTCTAQGYTTYTCSHCQDSYIDDYVAKIDHTPAEAVRENEVAATCTHTGNYEEVIYCSVCGVELSREPKQIEVVPHNYSGVTTSPTCTHAGYTTYTCEDCGYSYIGDFTDRAEHNYKDTLVEPTTESQGYTVHTCTVCGYSYVDSITDILPSEMHYIIPSLEEINATLTIKSDNNEYSVTSANGVFELDNIKGAVYRVYASQKNSLTVCIGEYDTKNGEFVNNDVVIPIGNVNGDDVIDMADISLLLSDKNYGKPNDDLDLTGDNFVDITDISVALQAQNYGAQSSPIV